MLNDEKYLWHVSLSFFPLNDGKLSLNSHKSFGKFIRSARNMNKSWNTGPLSCTGSPKLFLLFRVLSSFTTRQNFSDPCSLRLNYFTSFSALLSSLPCERLFTQMSPENFHNKWTTGVQIWVLYRRSSFRCFGSRQPRRINVGFSLSQSMDSLDANLFNTTRDATREAVLRRD